MSKRIFTEAEQQSLSANPNVIKCSDKAITYNPAFKILAVKESLKGKPPSQIFIEADFNLEVIGNSQPQRCLRRWRKKYSVVGSDGLLIENRGKCSSGRPAEKEISDAEKIRRLEAKIAYLESENELIKKLNSLEGRWLNKK